MEKWTVAFIFIFSRDLCIYGKKVNGWTCHVAEFTIDTALSVFDFELKMSFGRVIAT